jgi:peptide/nickel transport system substrate-binding protein
VARGSRHYDTAIVLAPKEMTMPTDPKSAPTDEAFIRESAWQLSRRSMLSLTALGGALALSPRAFAAGGADPKAKRGGTLTIGADADPIGLDPKTITAYSSYDFTSLMYTGLLRWTPDMQIEPDLATGYTTPDDTTYIFKLRRGVKFHNGQPFSAEDVKYTFDRVLNAASASRLKATFAGIESVTVIDPQTVQFKLKTSDAAFLRYMATNPDGVIVPKGVDGLDSKPVGTGPFKFVSYQPNQQFVLTANTEYYEAGLPHLKTVVFKFFKDQSALASALRSKAIDMTWFKNPKVAALIARTSHDLVSAPGQTSRTFPVWMNMKAAPLDDVRIRQALSLATDRKACLQTVLGGSGKVGAMIPESQIGGYDGVSPMPFYTHDPAAAKALLAKAGHPNGIDLGDYIVVAANDLDVACSQILQQQWAAAGIRVKLKPMETAPLLDMWVKGNWPTLLSVALSWSPDPDAILQRVASNAPFGKNMGMHDAELDKMIADARAQLDLKKRAAENMAIQQRIAENAYVLQIYQYPLRWEAWWDYVHGYQPLAANIRSYVRTTWVDK